jgi:hypothetical protein
LSMSAANTSAKATPSTRRTYLSNALRRPSPQQVARGATDRCLPVVQGAIIGRLAEAKLLPGAVIAMDGIYRQAPVGTTGKEICPSQTVIIAHAPPRCATEGL